MPSMGKDPSCLMLQKPNVLSDDIVPKDIMTLCQPHYH